MRRSPVALTRAVRGHPMVDLRNTAMRRSLRKSTTAPETINPVPTLRNVVLTFPYFHVGAQQDRHLGNFPYRADKFNACLFCLCSGTTRAINDEPVSGSNHGVVPTLFPGMSRDAPISGNEAKIGDGYE
ncbi:hypothetical protein D3C78_1106230 [compost metagenome]